MQIAQHKREICGLYKLAFKKDYNQNLSGSFKKPLDQNLLVKHLEGGDQRSQAANGKPRITKALALQNHSHVKKSSSSMRNPLPAIEGAAQRKSKEAMLHFSQFQMPS